MFNRLINLYRIQKLYGLIRDLIEQPKKYNNARHWKQIISSALLVKEIQEMFDFLKGYKTYIVAALTAAITVAHMLGYIDDETKNMLLTLLAAGGTATVAAKMNRINKRVEETEVEVLSQNHPGGNKKHLIILPFLLLMGSSAFAQTPTWTLEWDYTETTMTDVAQFTQTVAIDNQPLTTANITCAAKAGVANAVTCKTPIPVLADGIHTVAVTNSRAGMTATTSITGLDTNLAPPSATSPRVNITVNINFGK